MSAPTRYSLSYDFTAFQVASPTTPLPADKIEIEFNNVNLTTDQIIDNLSLIQRSDGALTNGVVSFDSLSSTVQALLGSAISPRGDWVTTTSYSILDLVKNGDASYICAVAHTSGTFATDYADGKWVLFAAGSGSITVNNSNWSGTDLTVSNGGTGVSSLMGIVKGNGGSPFSSATEGTDYYAPGGTDVSVADGGTGRSSHTEYAVICGGTSTTGAQQSVASVGTAGQILTSNGAGSLPTFQNISKPYRGAVAYNNTSQSIPDSVYTALVFQVEAIDTDGIHSTVSNTSRMTVPSGVTKVRLHTQCQFVQSNGDNKSVELRLYKNGTSLSQPYNSFLMNSVTSSRAVGCAFSSSIQSCIAGDYFEVYLNQNSGGTGIVSGSMLAYLEMEIIE